MSLDTPSSQPKRTKEHQRILDDLIAALAHTDKVTVKKRLGKKRTSYNLRFFIPTEVR